MFRIGLISFLKNSINTRSLSSYLKKNGYEVTCFFCSTTLNKNNMNRLVDLLKERSIDLVGVSLVTDDYRSAVIVTREVKGQLGLPVIWGGAHVNVRPEECLRHAEMVCLGEGEEALLDLAENMSRHGEPDFSIRNIWFRTREGIVKNELRPLTEDLDRYPFPDFDLDSQYVMTSEGFENLSEGDLGGEYSVMTSRGCPYNCNYCYNSYRRKAFAGKGAYLRKRSIQNVIDELLQAKRIFKKLSRINFWDDSFVTRGLEDFKTFHDLYRSKIKLPFFALIEPMAFNHEKIEILKDAGLSGLQVGIQTGSERINKEIYNRAISSRKVIDVAKYLNQLGINVKYDIIFNNPYETATDLSETINLLLEFPKPFALQGYNLIFYPGTAITEKALQDGYISEKQAEEDFSTIQSVKDSPVAMLGHSAVTSRFYGINYSSTQKKYLNTVVSLTGSNHVPKFIIRFFAKSETVFKALLLEIFIQFYRHLSLVNNKMTRLKQMAISRG
jgi:anaerobic magnesium-protoporphyrin IX monomethyl ester cyclase